MISYTMLRIVMDTDVIVAAARSPQGASAELIRHAIQGNIQLVSSTALTLEYEAVCTRQKHREAAGISHEEMLLFLDGIAALCEPTELYFLWRPQLRDINDEMVLETAINGQAEIITSFNIADYGKAGKAFGIEILRPRDLLKRIRT